LIDSNPNSVQNIWNPRMNERPDNPGVRVPPPLLYAFAILGGWLLDRRWPLPVGGDRARGVIAWLLIAGWVFLMGGGIWTLLRRRTSMLPFRPATAMVIEGPYRFSRNPMYVGMSLLTVAFGLLLNTWWPMLLLIPSLMALQSFVIDREERYMRRRFGAEYDAYTRRVRRWL
jgi:protein-S-isoprenylcysteine O-methyltransferase Ste14